MLQPKSLAKTARNAMIGFVVLGYAMHWARKRQAHDVGSKAAFLWAKFPKFVLGFLFISILATAHVYSKDQLTCTCTGTSGPLTPRYDFDTNGSGRA
jgi:uncharacterized membrane protein YadS